MHLAEVERAELAKTYNELATEMNRVLAISGRLQQGLPPEALGHRRF